MGEYNPDRIAPDQSAPKNSSGIPAGLFAALVVAHLALLGIGVRYYFYGDFNAIHCLLSLFFSINLLFSIGRRACSSDGTISRSAPCIGADGNRKPAALRSANFYSPGCR